MLGSPWRRAHELIPGVALAFLVTLLADRVGSQVGQVVSGPGGAGKGGVISGITCAIVLGLLFANVLQVRPAFRAGLEFSVRKLLRLGIILVGIKLSVVDVVRMGFWGVPAVLSVIVCALFLTSWFARQIGLSSRLATLAAASTAICGVTAVLAVAPTIDADDKEVAYTIANVTLFGMIAMLAYPYLAHWIFAGQHGAAGLFLGTAIHDTSQVMGAALSYSQLFGDEAAMKVATMTKLTRNVFLVAVVPFLAFQSARRLGCERRQVSLARLFPLFVLGFAAMAAVRSIGDVGLAGQGQRALGLWGAETWHQLTRFVGENVAHYALGTAMAAVGLTTDLKTFQGMGLKPLYVGAVSAIIVGGIGLALASLIGARIDPPSNVAPPLPPAAVPSAPARPSFAAPDDALRAQTAPPPEIPLREASPIEDHPALPSPAPPPTAESTAAGTRPHHRITRRHEKARRLAKRLKAKRLKKVRQKPTHKTLGSTALLPTRAGAP